MSKPRSIGHGYKGLELYLDEPRSERRVRGSGAPIDLGLGTRVH